MITFPASRFYISSTDINKAIDKLIKAASPYPDDNLIKAIDDVRVIVRKQELYINELGSILEQKSK